MQGNLNLSANFEEITQKDYKNLGLGLKLTYGINKTPFGEVLLAYSDKGITDLFFLTTSKDDAIKKLFEKWSKALFENDDLKTEKFIQQIFYKKENNTELKLHAIGTKFQITVWKALLSLSLNHTCSYSDISKIINNPKATRAVGTAIGQNPIHYLIPCHLVIRKNKNIGGYAGGIKIKEKILVSKNLFQKN